MKVNIGKNTLFQFLMVQLKEGASTIQPRVSKFQFLMVQLKGIRAKTGKSMKHVSIPYGTIKRLCGLNQY